MAGQEYSIVAAFDSSEYFGYFNTGSYAYSSSIAFTRMQSACRNVRPAMPPGNGQQWSDQYVAANFLVCEP